MPTPPRRRPTPTPQPARRPQVAGLRRPGVQPSPRPRHTRRPDEQEQPEPQRTAPEQVEEQRTAALPEESQPVPAAPADAGTETGTEAGSAAETGAGTDAGDAGVPEPAAPVESGSVRSGYALPGGLAVLAVLFLVAAVLFAFQYFGVQNSMANKAMVDPAATVNVKQDVTAAVETIFSYDYEAIEKTEQAADDLLITDEVRDVYNALYGEVKRNAPEQKIILTTKVSRIAVIDLSDDSARLLVFVDQSAVRQGEEEPSVGGSQLTVTAQRVDGKWKIADLDAYENRGK